MTGHRRRWSHCVGATLLCLLSAGAVPAQPRFVDDAGFTGFDSITLHTLAVVHRDDGHWLSFGTVIDQLSYHEQAWLIARDASGRRVHETVLAPEGELAYETRSLLKLAGGDVAIVLSEHDADDFQALRQAVVIRLNAVLEPVWSQRIGGPDSSIEEPMLRDGGDGRIALVGRLVTQVDGVRDRGDGLIVDLDPDDGRILRSTTLGIADAGERVVDLVPVGDAGERLALLALTHPVGPFEQVTSEGIALLEADGTVRFSQRIRHPVASVIRIQPLRLLPHPDGGWTLAGRRTAFGPNFYYLHRIGADLVPAAQRVLVPLFNVIDQGFHDGGYWLYGEANTEFESSGSTLMRLDAALNLTLQRRYGTRHAPFPTGGMAFHGNRALLGIGSQYEYDSGLLVYDSARTVQLADGEGLLCEETDDDGFQTQIDPGVTLETWPAIAAAVPLTGATISVTASALATQTLGSCRLDEDLVFADGFDNAAR